MVTGADGRIARARAARGGGLGSGRLVAAALGVALAAAGCTGDHDDTAATSSSTTSTAAPAPTSTTARPPTGTVPAPDETASFVEALRSRTPAGYAAARSASSPTSWAAAYVAYLAAADVALGTTAPRTVTSTGPAYEVCTPPSEDCARYSAFTLDARGRVVSFAVDGVPLDDRVVLGGPVDRRDGVELGVVAAYEGRRDSLLVVAEVVNRSEVTFRILPFASSYDGPGAAGRVDAGAAVGADVVEPGEVGHVLVAFPGSALGGTVLVPGLAGPDATAVRFVLALDEP